MEKEKKFKNGKFGSFMKKNMYLILMVVCIIAIATMVALTYVLKYNNGDEVLNGDDDIVSGDDDVVIGDDDDDVVNDLVFALPVQGEIVEAFCNDALVYNSTLNQWAVHEAVDISAAVGTEVKCAYDGVVTNISSDSLKGTVVVISHGNGMKSIYSLLDSEVSVTLNQTVKKGAVIGKISESGSFEQHLGAHLHYQLLSAQNVALNPTLYFESTDK